MALRVKKIETEIESPVESRINPSKLKFGYEKGLAGKDVYKKNARRNPFNGLALPLRRIQTLHK